MDVVHVFEVSLAKSHQSLTIVKFLGRFIVIAIETTLSSCDKDVFVSL